MIHFFLKKSHDMKKLMFLLLMLAASTLSMAQQIVTITDASLQGNQTYTWSKNNIYLLDGLVYLEAGGVLNIEAGTVIKGKTVPSTTDLSSSLIITRGAQINAVGRADAPIIFTGELDDISITTDLTANDNQTWGGLIILGNSIVGEDGGSDVIEGIASTETRIQYGGTNAADNSGTLKYVSIRHGGSVLGADNEINGLTLGGVGNGTTIDYVEVFATKDDGIELFGGTVNIKHAVVSFMGDDAFDFDESYNGYLQYVLSLTGDIGEHAVEYDGSEEANKLPKTVGRVYNGTFIGAGLNATNTTSRGLRLRNDGAVQFWNCIWTDVADYMFRVDDTSVDRLAAGESAFANNITWNFGAGRYVSGNNATVFAALLAGNTLQADPKLGGISRLPSGGLDPRPSNGSPALGGAATPTETGVETTAFRGAFSNTKNWATGWTALSQYGYFGNLAVIDNVITDADIQAGDTLVLTNDVEWVLDGYVFVEAGACLIIEPGTVIKGKTTPSNSDISSALIITRGAKIIAEGRADAPIIFTAEVDNLATSSDLTATDNQLWGGLLILGNAPIGEDGGFDAIEGLPSTETRIQYGGTNPEDSSGILKYVSIRHGGSVLGADNEINGLTLGGVGSGTVVDYVEIFANKDDGIEIFGGTVNVKHIVSSFVGDDAFDVDEAWQGFGQFVFTLAAGENAIEYDGTENAAFSCTTEPVGRIYNGTFIGDPANTGSRGARIRNNGSAQIWNSIFADIKDYVYRFDANSCGANAIAGNFVAPGFTTLVNGTRPSIFDAREVNPQLAGISRTPTGGLDPRPNAGSPVSFAAVYGDSREAARVPFAGAFSNAENWALGWTALDAYGYFGNLATTELKTIKDIDIQAGDTLTLTNTNEWLLDGYVYVENGACLIIEPGTIVKGKTVPSTVELASALIISRGGKIIAEGTEEKPIIFTGELDDLSSTTDLTANDNQTWGGLIILGNAPIGEDGGIEVIEGIPSTETRIQYGGTNPADNSGILKYVSIRHGGSVLGADNEINGLTLGGVGNGTLIDYVEIFANKDDGIEIFGGTVNVKHIVSSFVGDDAFDVDESWNGFAQYVFTLAPNEHAIEYDGTENAAFQCATEPAGRIYNGTFIGNLANSGSRGARIRNNGSAQIWNSVFSDITDYVYRFDANSCGANAIAANVIAPGFRTLVNGAQPSIFNITEINPNLGGISLLPNGGLDPRPNLNSPILIGVARPTSTEAEVVTFRGAFDCDNWAKNWTALSQYGYFGELATCTSSTYGVNEYGVAVSTYPNPTIGTPVTISFELPQTSIVNVKLYDMTGKLLTAINLGQVSAGSNSTTLNLESLPTGLYVVAVETALGTVTQKITVLNHL